METFFSTSMQMIITSLHIGGEKCCYVLTCASCKVANLLCVACNN